MTAWALLASAILSVVEPYPRDDSLPEPFRSESGDICYKPNTHRELAREILYCDWLVDECNQQIDDAGKSAQCAIDWVPLAVVAALSIGSIAAAVGLQSRELAGVGAGGMLAAILFWRW